MVAVVDLVGVQDQGHMSKDLSFIHDIESLFTSQPCSGTELPDLIGSHWKEFLSLLISDWEPLTKKKQQQDYCTGMPGVRTMQRYQGNILENETKSET